jgi:hypothetical protein
VGFVWKTGIPQEEKNVGHGINGMLYAKILYYYSNDLS